MTTEAQLFKITFNLKPLTLKECPNRSTDNRDMAKIAKCPVSEGENETVTYIEF